MKQTNISVFIPHYGCTHICSFCNQKTISGHSEPVTEKELEGILEGQLENLKDSGTKAQIAFFGGSFTAIDRDYMIRLLTVAKRYTDAYPEQYDGIRCSTRPDCIDEEILGILKSYGMTAIELGAQSMNDEVLTANRRGHTAQDVRRASRLIKQSGFELGLQMMTGLYKDTEQYCIDTAKEFRCFEDFDYRNSRQKIDFYRKWYHTRAKNVTVESLEEIKKYIFFMWLRPAVASFLSLAAFFSKKLDNIRFILYNQIEITKKVRWTK